MPHFNIRLSETQKGLLYMLLGILILLYAFNFFQKWLSTFVILAGFALVFYGFIKIDGVRKIQSLFGKK